MHKNAKDLSNQRFGRLVAITPSGRNPQGNMLWSCLCDCGTYVPGVIGSSLVRGNTKSCGCYKRDVTIESKTKHGYAGKQGRSAEYRSWAHAIGRCFNKTDKQYPDYGGRGIVMCRRWAESFEAFIADMGDKPSKSLSLDRINNEGNYSCGKCEECKANAWKANCRWATPTEQARNRRPRRKRCGT